MVASTWESRDLPVLEAIVELFDYGADWLDFEALVEWVSLPDRQVQTSLKALRAEEPSFFVVSNKDAWRILGVTGHARRTVGSWPTAELAAGRLIAGMEQAAEREPDEENRGRLRKTAAWFGGAGRDVAVDVAAAVINRQIGGA